MKIGRINCLKFFDKKVIDSNISRKNIEFKNEKQKNEFLFDLWIIIITDSKVLFFDYVGTNTKEIKLPELGGREQKTCELFWEGDFDRMIAFGGSDGNVRLWDFVKWNVAKVLNGTKG